jgi:uncharacterized protein (DUF4415 family)
MISDDPVEDADILDDDEALESYFDEASPKPDSRISPIPELPDWPARRTAEVGLAIDADTLAWFKATHVDWRREIRCVLRGWVAANTVPAQVAPMASGAAGANLAEVPKDTGHAQEDALARALAVARGSANRSGADNGA